MTENTIVAERSPNGGYEASANSADKDQLIRAYTPYDGDRVVSWDLRSSTPRWRSYSLEQISVGPCHAATICDYGHATVTFDVGKTWTTADGDGYRMWRYLTAYADQRKLYWTADQAYDALLVKGLYGATLGDLVVTLESGTATIVRATIDCHTTGSSPFEGADLSHEQYVVVATGIASGARISFKSSATDKDVRVYPLIAVSAAHGSPATVDNVQLGPALVNTGETRLDREVTELLYRWVGQGQHINMRFEDTANAAGAWWGSPAHCGDANNMIKDAGGTTIPTIALLRVDDANPGGLAWSPAIGGRIETEALVISVAGSCWGKFGAGGASYNFASWAEQFRIDAGGLSHSWVMVFTADANAAGLKAQLGGYNSSLSVLSGAKYARINGALGTPQALTLWDGTISPKKRASTIELYGGVYGDAVLRYVHNRNGLNGPGHLGFLQNTTDQSKIYGYYNDVVDSGVVAAGSVIAGGSRIEVYKAPLEPVGRLGPNPRIWR